MWITESLRLPDTFHSEASKLRELERCDSLPTEEQRPWHCLEGSQDNAAAWGTWSLPQELESRLVSLGIERPAKLGFLALYLLDRHGVLDMDVGNVAGVEHSLQEHLRANLFVSSEAEFSHQLFVSGDECLAVWKVQDGETYAISIAVWEGSDGDDPLSLIRESPDLVEFRWAQQEFAPASLLCKLTKKVSDIVNQLPDREQSVLSERFGLVDGDVLTLEEVGQKFGVTREWIRQIELRAIRKLRHPARIRHLRQEYGYLAGLARRLGCRMKSQDFSRAVNRLTVNGPVLRPGILALLEVISAEGTTDAPPSLDAFDQGVLCALVQQTEPLSADQVLCQNPAVEGAIRTWPQFDPLERMRLVLGVTVDEKRMCSLSNENESALSSGLKRLSAMLRIFRRANAGLHYTEVWDELQRELPDCLHLDARNVHAWLNRYKYYFKWVGPGTYALAEWGIGHRAVGLEPELRPARRKGVGDEVAALLLESGEPVHLNQVRDWILSRFTIKENSVLAAIQQDKAHRFVLLSDDYVGLAGRDDAGKPSRALIRRVRLPAYITRLAIQRATSRSEALRDALRYRRSTISDQELVRFAVLASCLGMREEFAAVDTLIPEGGFPPSMRLAMKEVL